MKKFFTLATMLLLSVSLFAFGPQARLTVSNNSRLKVTVSVDGRNYVAQRGADNGTDIIINDLNNGSHNIKIYQQESRGNSGFFGNKRDRLIYNDNIYVKPQYRTDFTINNFGRVVVNEQMTDYRNNGKNDNWQRGDHYNDGGWGNNNYHQAMDGRSFDQLQYLINRTNYENNKVIVAKQAIAGNYFTAAQISNLMQLFSFEGSRLDIAKFSFDYTTDKQNYFVVNDALAYNSSKNELARYLQQRR